MNPKKKLLVGIFIIIDILLILWLLLRNIHFPVLNPAGIIAIQERNVMFFLGGLGLLIIIPIVIFTFFVAFKYQEGNEKTKYTPNWNSNLKIEIFRWSFLSFIIGIFAITTWVVAHTLDPYKPLESNVKPITIQVVSLQWRWLFIYPEQNIATINFVEFPEKTPVNFELTSDAPMNSFWIPDLGGQIYTMSGMSTKTHFMADSVGEFPGSDAEISGKGFADMKFTAKSVTQNDFNIWVKNVKSSAKPLTYDAYKELAKPSTDSARTYYTLGDKNLYNKVIMQFMPEGKTKFMAPSSDIPNMKM